MNLVDLTILATGFFFIVIAVVFSALAVAFARERGQKLWFTLVHEMSQNPTPRQATARESLLSLQARLTNSGVATFDSILFIKNHSPAAYYLCGSRVFVICPDVAVALEMLGALEGIFAHELAHVQPGEMSLRRFASRIRSATLAAEDPEGTNWMKAIRWSAENLMPPVMNDLAIGFAGHLARVCSRIPRAVNTISVRLFRGTLRKAEVVADIRAARMIGHSKMMRCLQILDFERIASDDHPALTDRLQAIRADREARSAS